MTAATIAALNDAFREAGPPQDWVMTRSLHDKGMAFVLAAVAEVMSFNRFTKDNDPYGEHDFGSFEVAGEKLFWKIDYYDLTLTAGSDDPADPAKTRRVLTLMLASDY